MTDAIQIHVSFDEQAFAKEMLVFTNQVPYATARAINLVSQDAQSSIREGIHQRFVVRRPTFIDRSIKIKPFATKQTLTATISVSPPAGAKDVLSQHEEGGEKVSQRTSPTNVALRGGPNVVESQPHIAVPSENIRPDIASLIPARKRPARLIHTFKIDRGDKELLFMVVGRGSSRTVELAYTLLPQVRLQPRLEFISTATTTVSERWNQRFNEAWQYAIETSINK